MRKIGMLAAATQQLLSEKEITEAKELLTQIRTLARENQTDSMSEKIIERLRKLDDEVNTIQLFSIHPLKYIYLVIMKHSVIEIL